MINTKPKNHINKKEGFTLIETLVAITILLVSIVGPMEIASKGLFSAFYARDEITAYYLAQESIEYIRNARDTVYLLSQSGTTVSSWLEGLDECEVDDPADPGCWIETTENFHSGSDFNSSAIGECESGGCEPLNFSEENLYTYDTSDEPSKFTRTIKMTVEPSNQEILIESTVTWTVGAFFSSTKNFTLKERLYNWQN